MDLLHVDVFLKGTATNMTFNLKKRAGGGDPVCDCQQPVCGLPQLCQSVSRLCKQWAVGKGNQAAVPTGCLSIPVATMMHNSGTMTVFYSQGFYRATACTGC